MLAFSYEQGFRLHLLLQGISPDSVEFEIQIAERKTETRNQRADLALKYQALGAPEQIIFEVTGMDYTRIESLREEERKKREAYPEDDYPGDEIQDDIPSRKHNISITPGNAPKKESATYVNNGV